MAGLENYPNPAKHRVFDTACGWLARRAPRWPGTRGILSLIMSHPLNEAPTCNCILLCDDVLVSQAKGKHMLNGIIGVILVGGVPAILGGYVAYIRLSNVYGPQLVTVNLKLARTDDTIFEFDVKLPKEADPLGVYTLVVPIPLFQVAELGRYTFTAWSNQLPLAQTPIMIQGP